MVEKARTASPSAATSSRPAPTHTASPGPAPPSRTRPGTATFQAMEFKALIQRALAIRGRYADYEVKTYGREWTTEELVLVPQPPMGL